MSPSFVVVVLVAAGGPGSDLAEHVAVLCFCTRLGRVQLGWPTEPPVATIRLSGPQQPPIRWPRPGLRSSRPEPRCPQPELRSPRPEPRCPQPEPRCPQPEPRWPRPEQRSPQPERGHLP